MDPNTPVWALSAAAAIVALVGAGYGVVKLVSHVGDKWLEWRKKKRQADRDDEDADERSSTHEAWEVVDRLTAELERVEPRIQGLERSVQDCQQQHATEKASHDGTRRILRIVVAWAESNKMKLPPDMKAELQKNGPGPDPQGSDVHRSIGQPPTDANGGSDR